jgi:hypothetical protein
MAKGLPAHGEFDMEFRLFDSLERGVQVGPTLVFDSVPVRRKQFTVLLDFGAESFDGASRWLQIALRDASKKDPFISLTPRQQLWPVPYAIHAGSAARLTGTIGPGQLPPGLAYLASNQTFTGTVGFNPTEGPPFLVGSAAKVPGLNSDLLDGLDGSAFALSGHTHSAGDLVSGFVPDERIAGEYSSQVAFRNLSNSFVGSFAGDGGRITISFWPTPAQTARGLCRLGRGWRSRKVWFQWPMAQLVEPPLKATIRV